MLIMLVNFSGHPSTWTTQRMFTILTELLCSRLTEKLQEETDRVLRLPYTF